MLSVGQNPVLYAVASLGVFQDVAVQLPDSLRVNSAALDDVALELDIGVAEIEVNLVAAVRGGPGFGDNLDFVGGDAGAYQEIAEGAAYVVFRRSQVVPFQ